MIFKRGDTFWLKEVGTTVGKEFNGDHKERHRWMVLQSTKISSKFGESELETILVAPCTTQEQTGRTARKLNGVRIKIPPDEKLENKTFYVLLDHMRSLDVQTRLGKCKSSFVIDDLRPVDKALKELFDLS